MTVISRDHGIEKTRDSIASDGSKRSVDGRRGDQNHPFLHSQVLRIREEDLRIGEGVGEGLSARDGDRIVYVHFTTHVEAFLCSRPILPSSPLGNKTAINSSFR